MEKGNDEDDTNKSTNSMVVTPLSTSRKLKGKIMENNELPLDILGLIVDKLNIEEKFQISRVSKSWGIFYRNYWTKFTTSPAPLLVQVSFGMKSYSIFKIFEQKHELDYCHFEGYSYIWCSNGYMIMGSLVSCQILLLNPFTRTMKEVDLRTPEGNFVDISCNALLAFVKGSKEFIIVGLGKSYKSLRIYHSQNSCWFTCSEQEKENSGKVVDFVVLQNSIYVITDNVKIGVLNLNSSSLEFLNLKNAPDINSFFLKLVNCDGHLLVVDFEPERRLNVYKIDFSTMSYLKLETLGDFALFYGSTRCYALNNPKKWGYENNFVYCANSLTNGCKVYSGDRAIHESRLSFEVPAFDQNSLTYCADWYFRHQRDEVDYSVDE